MKSEPVKTLQHWRYPYFPLMMLIHGTSALIDVSVIVVLVSSGFFKVSVNEDKFTLIVALLVSLVPFIVLAPSASLLVEKIRLPRISLTIGINALRLVGLFLMALAAANSSSARLVIFPLAFLMLTLSRCYVVMRTSALPQITNVESFPYFSSRLSMASGTLAVIFGSFIFALNRVFSESFTLYVTCIFVFFGICISVFSYFRLKKRVKQKEIDANLDGYPDLNIGEFESSYVELSPRNRARAIKSLFTYAASIRFAVGAVTLGVVVSYSKEHAFLVLCFITATLISFLMNLFSVQLTRSKRISLASYVVGGVLVVCSGFLFFASEALVYVLICAALGGVSAFTRVVYESRVAHIVPSEFGARLLARGEVWMQLLWVTGATIAVVSKRPVFLGIFICLAGVLSIWAYASAEIALRRTSERF